MNMIDTHAHLDFEDYDADRDVMIQTAQSKGIEKIIVVGTDGSTSQAAIELAQKYNCIYAAVGWHPHDVVSFDEICLKNMLQQKKVVALGEIGLDYFKDYAPKNEQKRIFAAQLAIAADFDIPIIIHDREAHEDTLEILDKYHPKKVVFHCFSGDYVFAEKLIERGWYLSFTGTITFSHDQFLPIIRDLPSDRFFVETDSPYLTPKPFRGKRNRPEYVSYMIETIAHYRNDTPRHIAALTTENAKRFFSLP